MTYHNPALFGRRNYPDPWPEHCVRCPAGIMGQGAVPFTMSYFNTDAICIECARDERELPGYAAARMAEEAAVLGGNFNYQGVGLTADDLAALAELRAKRRPK